MGSVLVLIWRDSAVMVELKLTRGLAVMAAPVRSRQWSQEGNINSGAGTLLLWSTLALMFLGGGRIRLFPGSRVGG
jgi:hypothetical protein